FKKSSCAPLEFFLHFSGIAACTKQLLKEHVNVHTLKEAVTDVLSNEKYKHGIRKLNDSFLECGGSKEAIAVIESLLNKVKI
ncbi:hypothetical protein NPM07_32775, partial [Bacillus cereus]|nr:hypothetical protein [Bacillus cereus]